MSKGMLFQIGDKVQTQQHGVAVVQGFFGGGGQGEVYQVVVQGRPYALKWYFDQMATPQQREVLLNLLEEGPPDKRFLWPLDLAFSSERRGFGYLMEVRPSQFHSLNEWESRRVAPTFRVLCKTGLELADAFKNLHARGMCYRDISVHNVFFNPNTGEVLICDNDNVTYENENPGVDILGTPGFMAPELVCGNALPSQQTDLHSLAVLLFHLLMLSDPFAGQQEAAIHCLDLPAMRRLYGDNPVFIWHRQDHSNRPVPGIHDNAIIFWKVYPHFLRDKFHKAFTEGLNPARRVRESEWIETLVRLYDSVLYCRCGKQNFYDRVVLQQGKPLVCWSCQGEIPLPPRMRINLGVRRFVVMLNFDSKLYPHHIDPNAVYALDRAVAEVRQHPVDKNIWGLTNLSTVSWSATLPDGTIRSVPPGKSIRLQQGLRIHFGLGDAEIRV